MTRFVNPDVINDSSEALVYYEDSVPNIYTGDIRIERNRLKMFHFELFIH